LFGFVTTRPGRHTAEEFVALRRAFVHTILHEVAHHADSEHRERGAKSSISGERRAESFAERMSERWFEEYVDPSLLSSLDDVRDRYAIVDFEPALLSAVFARASALAEQCEDWSKPDWASCLCRAAESLESNVCEITAAAAEPLDQYFVANPGCRDTKEGSIASFRYVACALLRQTSPG